MSFINQASLKIEQYSGYWVTQL